MSEIGLEPWYAAVYSAICLPMGLNSLRRLIGFSGRGVLSWYGTAVQPDYQPRHSKRRRWNTLTLERVEQHIQTSGNLDFPRAPIGIVGVDDTQSGLQSSRGDTGLE